MLKALYGDAATKQTDWAFSYLPKVDRNFSWVQLWDNMYNGIVKGIFAFGMNGVAIGPDSRKNIDALKKADWLVVGEIYEDETSEFWRSPGISADEMKQIQNHRLSFTLCGFCGKRRHLHQFRALVAMEKRGPASPWRLQSLIKAIVAQIFLRVRAALRERCGKISGSPYLNWRGRRDLIPPIHLFPMS